jgi:hypothetical protein
MLSSGLRCSSMRMEEALAVMTEPEIELKLSST